MMLSLRPVARAVCARQPVLAVRYFADKKKGGGAVAAKGEEEGGSEVSAVAQQVKSMTEEDYSMLWKSSENYVPTERMPDNLAEIAALDDAIDDVGFKYHPDGTERIVKIRQEIPNTHQAPLTADKLWKISFEDDGEEAHAWNNPLMGWKSTADPMSAFVTELYFPHAQKAVEFAKKRGWKYLVEHPRIRILRDDDRQYQDNFLPQDVAAKVKLERTQCDHWKRSKAGASHYFRPLKYHGGSTVPQHGPNPDAKIAKETEPYYKMR